MGSIAAGVLAKHGVVVQENELAHYGTLGMRWGKRKRKPSSTSPEPHRPDPSKMSDAELKSALARLKMEKEFKQLTKPELTRGQKIANKILAEVGTVAATQTRNYVNAEIGKAIAGAAVKAAAQKAAKEAAKKTVISAVKAA